MNTNATLEQIKELKLQGMVRSYEATIQLPVNQHPEGHQLIAQLADAEKQNRTQYKTQLFLKLSKLRYGLWTGANGLKHTTCAASNP